MIKTISNSIKRKIIRRFGNKTRLLALIGSGNSDDFDSLSDLDYLLILDSFSTDDLRFIAAVRDEIAKKNQIPIDIKAYTIPEWIASEKYPIGILHAWTIQMMIDGKITIIFQDKIILKEKKMDIRLSTVIAMNYFMDKLRKYLSVEKVYLRGKIKKPNNTDSFKVLTSCCFCIAKFFLFLRWKRIGI